MIPNPQEALPLPPHPSLEQYRKLAKELVKACESKDSDAIGRWTDRWIASLARALATGDTERVRRRMDNSANEIEEFARRQLKSGARQCALADAQCVLAASHGFTSWPTFVAHIGELSTAGTAVAAFESAADAIVQGDEVALRTLLHEHPALIRARSTRKHGATLLHYVSANGVEGYRQRTPINAVRIAEVLLDAGAEVDAEADAYGGGSTTLGLVATSVHPHAAGVQLRLLQLLLDHGARIEGPPIAGNGQGIVLACLANGRGEAARFLAEHGARLDLPAAAGTGFLDGVKLYFDESGNPLHGVTPHDIQSALHYACDWGHTAVVRFLLAHGASLSGAGSDGQTPLHHAVIGGKLDIVNLLLGFRPPLESRNRYGGTVMGQTLWSAAHGGDPDTYIAIIQALLDAGAELRDRHPPINAKVDAFLAAHGSASDETWYWFGEQPRKRKA